MAAGRCRTSALPSIWTHSPKKASVNRQSVTRGSRSRLRVLVAVSRVLTMLRPASSAVQVTGDVCGRPSACCVIMTARWCFWALSWAWLGSTEGASEAYGASVQLVLVHQRHGVAVGESVFVRQPVDPLVTAEE